IVVFYLGDFDSSGMDIERDLRARVEEHTFRTFEVRRVAIFADDIKKFNLPPQRVKSEDPRADSFRKAHGRQCVELDALQPVEMRAAAAWNITRKFVDRLVASPRTRRRARSEPSKPGTVGWNWRHAGKSRNRGFGPALASAPQERSESPASGLAVMFVLSGDR